MGQCTSDEGSEQSKRTATLVEFNESRKSKHLKEAQTRDSVGSDGGSEGDRHMRTHSETYDLSPCEAGAEGYSTTPVGLHQNSEESDTESPSGYDATFSAGYRRPPENRHDYPYTCAEVRCISPGCQHHVHRSSSGDNSDCSFERLQHEATQGCQSCDLVRQILTKFCSCEFSRNGATSFTEVIPCVHACEKVRYVLQSSSEPRIWVTWTCGRREMKFAHGTTDLPTDYTLSSHPLLSKPMPHFAQDLLSEIHVQRCRDLLAICDVSHPLCTVSGTQRMPTRVLHLTGGSTGSQITLWETTGSYIPYAALSYCWGGPQPARTTSSNLQDRKEGIKLEGLPRTCQDAILFARALNISCIWVDSLCIVQDDKTDWERESSKMGQIYQQAYVVFVVASSRDAKTGFLHERMHRFQRSVTYQAPDGTLYPVQVNELLQHPRDTCWLTPIASRAWTHQERVMARRCLIFTAQETSWECKKGLTCDCMKSHLHQNELLPNLRDAIATTVRHFATADDAYRFWDTAVSTYSRRNITMCTDRLPAICALANVVQAATGSEYLAGLWKHDLQRQLTWRPCHPAALACQPFDRYVAPSWSWASFSGPVTNVNPPERLQTDAKVVKAWCQPSGLNILGAVEHGMVVLEAAYVDAEIALPGYRLDGSDLREMSLTLVLTSVVLSWASRFLVASLDYPEVWTLAEHQHSNDRLALSSLRPARNRQRRDSLCVVVRFVRLTIDQYLILGFCSHESGAFQRLGLVDFEKDIWELKEAEDFQQAFGAAWLRSEIEIV